MQKHLVVTLVGPDRVGIVDHVTDLVLKKNGNVEESRMARLGGDFAVLMLVSVAEMQLSALNELLSGLKSEGFQVFTRETSTESATKYQGWLPYKIEVTGADHEGIIHAITHHLAEKQINVEMMNTDTAAAPMSGTLLFSMSAVVLVPPELAYHDWVDGLDAIGDTNNVTVEVETYKG